MADHAHANRPETSLCDGIEAAFRVASARERAALLHRLVDGLLPPTSNAPLAADAVYGAAYREIAQRRTAGAFGEVELAAIAARDLRLQAICGLAALADAPNTLAERALLAAGPDLLLLLCRALDFAWSTTATLLALRRPRDEDAAALFERYHAMTGPSARRLVRFMRVVVSQPYPHARRNVK